LGGLAGAGLGARVIVKCCGTGVHQAASLRRVDLT
jgi:hypothetical protein